MSAPKFTFAQFKTRFPDDDACLSYLFNKRYADATECPKCEEGFKYHQCKGNRYHVCQHCGHHIHPTAGTIMQDSKTPLVSWLFVMLLFANSKNGVSAKEIQRQIGVTYKTAWRMGHLIRSLMDESGTIVLDGVVEMDETLVGGRKRGGKRGWGADKPCVFGMVERGGKIVTQVVPNRQAVTLYPIITQHTTEDVIAHTDDFSVYRKLHHEVAEHHVIQHTKGFYVHEDVHTQTIDGHWSIIKRSIRGTHTSVSRKYLQAYLNEFSFRRNHKGGVMFDEILGRV
jgi:transposase